MGRTGGGGSGSRGGGGFSHSSHSVSRSHSSHSTGSTGRSSFSSSSSSSSNRPKPSTGGSSFGFGGSKPPKPTPPKPVPPPPPPPPRRAPRTVFVNRTTYVDRPVPVERSVYTRKRRRGMPLWLTLLVIFILIVGLSSIYTKIGNASASQVPISTVNREKLSGGSFTPDCVDDQLGWIGPDAERLGEELRRFWKETGIQPYVVLLPFDTAWDTDDERYDVADTIYENQIGREDAMLLVYFDSDSEDTDGSWEMVKGLETGALMDQEATEIFWSFLDRYWSDLSYSEAEAINMTFTKAAERIMTKTTTRTDVNYQLLRIVLVLIGFVTTVYLIKMYYRYEHESDEENTEGF